MLQQLRFKLPHSISVPVVASLFILVTISLQAQQGVAGEWTGEIEMPGSRLDMEITLVQEGERWSGEYSIPAQNLLDMKMEDLVVTDSVVTFELGNGIPGAPSFSLEVSDGGKKLVGFLKQGGVTLPSTFARSGASEVESARPIAIADIREDIQAWADSVRALWKVPGLSIAIVRGDEVMSLASGLRNVEEGLPVTTGTEFAIGSTTKAFTATLLGTLVDEGLIDWEDHVTDHLPDFELQNRQAVEVLRVEDLLTHTSGLPRHDFLWYLGSTLSRADLYERLRYLEPTALPNQKWQYQNLMFMVAGLLAERVTGRSWEDLLEERILEPVGMASGTTLDVEALSRTPNHALGYSLDEEADAAEGPVYEVVPYHNLNAIAPAGAINTSADAILGWLRMNLDEGIYRGEQVVGSATLQTIQAPHVVMPGEGGFRGKEFGLYGFGWMISSYRGERLVYHGGAIDGFVAHIALLPEEKIGVAVMVNRSSGLPEPMALDLIDMVRGEKSYDHALTLGREMERFAEVAEEVEVPVERVEGTSPSHDLADYVGRYAHPAYDTIEITLKDDRLGAEYFDRSSPLEHFHYDVFEVSGKGEELQGLKVNFQGNIEGTIDRLAIPLETTLGEIEFERLPDDRLTDPEYLRQYVGEWSLGARTFTLSERRGRLYVDIPGQPVYELEPEGITSDGTATFGLEGLPGFRVRFSTEEGEVVATFLQPNGTFRATRKG